MRLRQKSVVLSSKINIETTLAENYDKLRKQLQKQNFVSYNDYKATIEKLEVKIYSIEDILLKELSKLEKLVLMPCATTH